MKHLPRLLSCLMVLVLASCGKQYTPVGDYKFQLGSDKGTHVGITMTLSDEDYTNGTKTFGKKFVLSANMSGMNGGTTTTSEASQEQASSQASEESSEEESSAAMIGSNDFKMSGYYTIGDEYVGTAKEKRLYLGTTILNDFFADSGITINVNEEIVEKVLYATISKNTVNVEIPVSLDDLAYQMYWYGYRVDIDNIWENPFEILPTDQHHEVGTHPTTDDIDTICKNEAARGVEDNMFESFRDYHTLKMGLVR